MKGYFWQIDIDLDLASGKFCPLSAFHQGIFSFGIWFYVSGLHFLVFLNFFLKKFLDLLVNSQLELVFKAYNTFEFILFLFNCFILIEV